MSFSRIMGQDKAIALLKSIVTSGRLPPSLLFWGQEGIGKRLTASTFAKAINCQEEGFEPCDKCSSCKKIDANNHPDVHFIPREAAETNDKKSESIKIEDIRELQRYTALKPFEAKKKICIIDEAQKLTAEAANAFLKILEEPPKDTLFILISSQPNLLFSTIISRCQKIRFYAMEKLRLQQLLRNVYGLDEPLAHFLAYFSEGRLGAALRLKDRDTLRERDEIIDSYIGDNTKSYDAADKADKQALKYSLQVMLAWVRDVYLIKTGIPHSELINFDRTNQILKAMPRLTFYDLDLAVNYLSDAAMYLEQNINPKLILANLKARLWTKLHR